MFYKVTDETNGIERSEPIFYCNRLSVNTYFFWCKYKVDLGGTIQIFVIFSRLCLKTFLKLTAKTSAKFYLQVAFSITIPHRC